jgi:hypothetical protein
MPGLTTTMYAIVKKVVMPPARSPYFDEVFTAGYCAAGADVGRSRRQDQDQSSGSGTGA